MGRSRIKEDQAEDIDFLSEAEHTGIGNASPHHPKLHTLADATSHSDVLITSPVNKNLLSYDSALAKWKNITTKTLADSLQNPLISLSFSNASGGTDYSEISSTSYAVVASFIFQGTTVHLPTFFKAIVSASGASSNNDVRLFDYTNGLEIAAINYTNQAKIVVTSGALSNLPVNPAIFEVQVRKNSTAKARIHFLGLE